jgi:hypothetical protein
MHEPLSNLRKVIFVQYAQGTPRTEVWRGLHGAATLLADCGKICIAVSEDIDPTNTDAVFWSLAYRSNPIEDAHIAPHRSAGHGPKSGPRSEESTLLIERRSQHTARWRVCAAIHGAREDDLAGAASPALTPQPPWHGYSLGDWSREWDVYERAVAGQWEQSKRDLHRRRGGLIPETPVREVEGRNNHTTTVSRLAAERPHRYRGQRSRSWNAADSSNSTTSSHCEPCALCTVSTCSRSRTRRRAGAAAIQTVRFRRWYSGRTETLTMRLPRSSSGLRYAEDLPPRLGLLLHPEIRR